MDKRPIHKFKIFCAYCDNDMGIVNSFPTCIGYVEPVEYAKQKYRYIIVKEREEGHTYFVIKTFCSKICEDKYCKKKRLKT